MKRWRSIGASVIGPAHVTDGKPNQDAWRAFHRKWGFGIAISDGVGSKPLADIGSRYACRAVAQAAWRCHSLGRPAHDALPAHISTCWQSLITPLPASDCAATCLFAVRLNDGLMRIGMLGDGLAAVLKTDGSMLLLSEDKSAGFSNMTAALSADEARNRQHWQHATLPEDQCDAVLLCTDGVADDLIDAEGFTRGAIAAYRKLSTRQANRAIRDMLRHWATPKHSDDKTLACLLREEIHDE
ncbi:PP2C family serine/threonine-protein phosphatase [Herbaspirillum sp. VT-16-41]|uniref:PP2C family serine/threonine-protein phosphatase n=1 Tax=Herbaspirillum sp. VT-16-41 TaxID=1953765 RepID=UPI0009809C84|nr:PP2C family serine/threonine-protein phosphatase [Herbaspirillum sp. VT-16-41]ONN67921.1 hypothetical protein BTM36_03780 [Herbaspirillum sp. VT-16-41]